MDRRSAATVLAVALAFLAASAGEARSARVEIRVVQDDSPNQPIPGVMVRVYRKPQSQSTPPYNLNRLTNRHGEAVFPALAPSGVYVVELGKQGCTLPPQDHGLTIPGNAQRVQRTLRLDCPPQSTVRAAIRVVEHSNPGQVVRGALVRVYLNPTAQGIPPYDKRHNAGRNGQAEFLGLVNNGSYLVEARRLGCEFPAQDQNLMVPSNAQRVNKTVRLDCRGAGGAGGAADPKSKSAN